MSASESERPTSNVQPRKAAGDAATRPLRGPTSKERGGIARSGSPTGAGTLSPAAAVRTGSTMKVIKIAPQSSEEAKAGAVDGAGA
jgi:hypothetical protein